MPHKINVTKFMYGRWRQRALKKFRQTFPAPSKVTIRKAKELKKKAGSTGFRLPK